MYVTGDGNLWPPCYLAGYNFLVSFLLLPPLSLSLLSDNNGSVSFDEFTHYMAALSLIENQEEESEGQLLTLS